MACCGAGLDSGSHSSCLVVRARSGMVARAAAAVVAVAGAIVYCWWLVSASRAFYWTLAAAEACFLVYYFCIKIPLFNIAQRQSPPGHDASFIKQRLIGQLLHGNAEDAMAVMESWFLEAGTGDVKRDNLKELFAYAIYYKAIGEMEAEGMGAELEDIMVQLESKYGWRLQPGYNPSLRFMSHLWEPLRHMYRPLLVYLVMEVLTLLCHVALLATGFRLRQIDGITYYTYRVGPQLLVPAISAPMKRGRSTMPLPSTTASCNTTIIHDSSSSSSAGSSADLPIVFLHGVGAGLLPYLPIIFRLVSLGQPMILPHSKHVSMRLVSWIPTVDDMADATAAMLAAHGYSRAAVVAHSYGTTIASRLVIKYPQLVHSMCLTDPVCFAMFMPQLLASFLYARHSSGCWWMDTLLKFVASELHCCANFSRKFFWSSINLWDEHIPDRTLVVLGGKDILSPAAHLDRWLREHTRAQVMYEPSMLHAGMLLSMAWQASIVKAFVDLMQQPDSEQAQDTPLAAADKDTPAGGAEALCVQKPCVPAGAAAEPGAEECGADGVAVIRVVPAAAAGASAGSIEGPHHCCKHPHSRMCSDCLSSSFPVQQQEGSAAEQAQQLGGAGLAHRGQHASAAKQQQKRQVEKTTVAASEAAAAMMVAQPACC